MIEEGTQVLVVVSISKEKATILGPGTFIGYTLPSKGLSDILDIIHDSRTKILTVKLDTGELVYDTEIYFGELEKTLTQISNFTVDRTTIEQSGIRRKHAKLED